MGGRGSSSGMSSGGGWGRQPELTGSSRQVSWANEIRQSTMETIDFNIRSSKEHYERTGIVKSMIKRDLYSDMKKGFADLFSKTTNASDIINIRNRLSARNINGIVDKMASEMSTQVFNGWVYDKKTHKTRKR